MTLNRFHKTVFALIAVIAPLYWLTLTADGQRRVDSVLLHIAGEPAIEINLKAMDGQLTETELKRVFPDHEWHCRDQASPFGQRLCVAAIGTFNGLPAHYVTVFFGANHATALKLAYRSIYHDQLLAQLVRQLGDPTPSGAPPDKAVLRWQTAHSSVVIKQTLLEQDEPALLWLPR